MCKLKWDSTSSLLVVVDWTGTTHNHHLKCRTAPKKFFCFLVVVVVVLCCLAPLSSAALTYFSNATLSSSTATTFANNTRQSRLDTPYGEDLALIRQALKINARSGDAGGGDGNLDLVQTASLHGNHKQRRLRRGRRRRRTSSSSLIFGSNHNNGNRLFGRSANDPRSSRFGRLFGCRVGQDVMLSFCSFISNPFGDMCPSDYTLDISTQRCQLGFMRGVCCYKLQQQQQQTSAASPETTAPSSRQMPITTPAPLTISPGFQALMSAMAAAAAENNNNPPPQQSATIPPNNNNNQATYQTIFYVNSDAPTTVSSTNALTTPLQQFSTTPPQSSQILVSTTPGAQAVPVSSLRPCRNGLNVLASFCLRVLAGDVSSSASAVSAVGSGGTFSASACPQRFIAVVEQQFCSAGEVCCFLDRSTLDANTLATLAMLPQTTPAQTTTTTTTTTSSPPITISITGNSQRTQNENSCSACSQSGICPPGMAMRLVNFVSCPNFGVCCAVVTSSSASSTSPMEAMMSMMGLTTAAPPSPPPPPPPQSQIRTGASARPVVSTFPTMASNVLISDSIDNTGVTPATSAENQCSTNSNARRSFCSPSASCPTQFIIEFVQQSVCPSQVAGVLGFCCYTVQSSSRVSAPSLSITLSPSSTTTTIAPPTIGNSMPMRFAALLATIAAATTTTPTPIPGTTTTTSTATPSLRRGCQPGSAAPASIVVSDSFCAPNSLTCPDPYQASFVDECRGSVAGLNVGACCFVTQMTSTATTAAPSTTAQTTTASTTSSPMQMLQQFLMNAIMMGQNNKSERDQTDMATVSPSSTTTTTTTTPAPSRAASSGTTTTTTTVVTSPATPSQTSTTRGTTTTTTTTTQRPTTTTNRAAGGITVTINAPGLLNTSAATISTSVNQPNNNDAAAAGGGCFPSPNVLHSFCAPNLPATPQLLASQQQSERESYARQYSNINGFSPSPQRPQPTTPTPTRTTSFCPSDYQKAFSTFCLNSTAPPESTTNGGVCCVLLRNTFDSTQEQQEQEQSQQPSTQNVIENDGVVEYFT